MSCFYTFDDGTLSFLVDAIEKDAVAGILAKHYIEVLNTVEGIFDRTGKAVEIEFFVDSNETDVSLALADMIKYIRPYSEGYVHTRHP